MSGHSKWSQIKRQKGTADQKRGALFTKLGNVITIAAKEMGGNPESNFKLRLAIDKAKSANMPKDNIERAIKRGTGELAGAQIEEIVYEAFGPQGIALIIETLTDNKNRTASEVKHIITKYGGRLGGPNSVIWMFERKGVVRTMNSELKTLNLEVEAVELKAIDLGATDVKEDEDSLIIYTKPEDLQKVKEALEEEIKIEYAELEHIAKDQIKIENESTKLTLEKIFNDLDENEDVNNYYTNAEF